MDHAEDMIRLWRELSDESLELDLRNLGLSECPEIPNNVKTLYLSGNTIEDFDLPDSIEVLDISRNQCITITNLPENLIELYANNNHIELVDWFPDNLQIIMLQGNSLKELPDLPRNLLSLFVGKNMLEKLPILPEKLENMDISYNKLRDCPGLPGKLKHIWCHANYLRHCPVLPESLLSGTISYKNLFPENEIQSGPFPHIRGNMIIDYRLKIQKAYQQRCKEQVSKFKEELIAKHGIRTTGLLRTG